MKHIFLHSIERIVLGRALVESVWISKTSKQKEFWEDQFRPPKHLIKKSPGRIGLQL